MQLGVWDSAELLPTFVTNAAHPKLPAVSRASPNEREAAGSTLPTAADGSTGLLRAAGDAEVPRQDGNTRQEATRGVIDPVTGTRCPRMVMINRRVY